MGLLGPIVLILFSAVDSLRGQFALPAGRLLFRHGCVTEEPRCTGALRAACASRKTQDVRTGCRWAKAAAHLLRRLQEPAALPAADLSDLGMFSSAT